MRQHGSYEGAPLSGAGLVALMYQLGMPSAGRQLGPRTRNVKSARCIRDTRTSKRLLSGQRQYEHSRHNHMTGVHSPLCQPGVRHHLRRASPFGIPGARSPF
jgi:hypothetical protein